MINSIEAHPFEEGGLYVAATGYKQDDFAPYLYRTTDWGQSWTKITDGIADDHFTRVIRADPDRSGLLYSGTERGVYVSFDDGDNWQSLHTNLPHTPMYWTQIQPHFNDLVIGTYGRGFWIMDDITPFQQLTDEVMAAAVHLFEPRDAYRFQGVSEVFAMFDDQSDGENPPYGALLSYHLSQDAAAALAGDEDPDSTRITIQVMDGEGGQVRRLEGPARAGVNRTAWDLRHGFDAGEEEAGDSPFSRGPQGPLVIPGSAGVPPKSVAAEVPLVLTSTPSVNN